MISVTCPFDGGLYEPCNEFFILLDSTLVVLGKGVNMESGYSGLRNLLLIVLVLAALAVLSNFYVASQLSRNSDELASIRLLIQKQMMGQVMTQLEELQKRMDSLNQTASGIDAKMKQAQDEMDAKLKKAQDDLVARMQLEMPKIMDNYVKTHTPALERQAQQELQKRGVPVH